MPLALITGGGSLIGEGIARTLASRGWAVAVTDINLDLARQARAGDESAFSEIVRRYSPRVFKVASRFFRQRSLVEEAAQEVFLKAFTQLKSYEGRGSMEGWRRRRRRQPSPTTSSGRRTC